jgi:hypothetical protein
MVKQSQVAVDRKPIVDEAHNTTKDDTMGRRCQLARS